MNLSDYQREASRTLNVRLPEREQLSMVALGLSGESGEVADEIKKALFHGHGVNREKLLKEIGDVLWYVAAAASVLGAELEDIAEGNLEKLRARFPDGFSEAASKARVDAKGGG